ncbi:mitochondrial pyruvate dehydrogenase [Auriscalpium vulgare]|uniref:Mitochondrial pyruvate dehydrogenase n=1 Tax=Auriscalpium vulgare TaxID=40419 RepID=A0ACB8S8Y3_9AGAM|nr:mitochondrial pyruvate dehydrogenase [Auriscalpium vulgare]
MSMFKITPSLWDRIHHFASFPQTGVSLQQMVRFGQNPSQGTLLRASQFLVEELPVRLAHRVKELDELPHNLSHMPSIQKVRNWYAQSFDELVNFPPVKLPAHLHNVLIPTNASSIDPYLPESTPNPSLEDLKDHYNSHNSNGNANRSKLRIPVEKRYYASIPTDTSWPPEVHDYNVRFTKLLESIKRRHDPTVTTVAQGVLEWKRSQGAQRIGLDMQAWLDRFYMSRIGIRFLIGQRLCLPSILHEPGSTSTEPSSPSDVALNTLQPHQDYVGIICTRSNVHDIVHEAIENARFVASEHYALFAAPPVQLICPRDLHFAYVPGHLSHIVFELLKNSLRAVIERHNKIAGAEPENFPPIKVVVVEGSEDITIKISDEGGGIARSAVPLIWTYMYTTMEGQGIDQDFQASDFNAPMAGFGYGLPLSRLYARYFGGDLKLISMDGFGTDVYIHLNRLSSSKEPLP